jgi:DNA-binding GntR family transcriptional regulator
VKTYETSEIEESPSSETVGRGNTLDFIVDHIRQGILSGIYALGQRLIEADLTKKLGVSRGPIREAFRQLAAEGLVESASNRGTIVRQFSENELRDLYQIRIAMETLAVRLAAENIDKANHREHFRDILQMLETNHARYSPFEFFQENNHFHQVIADISGNQQLAGMIRKLQIPFVIYRLNRNMQRQISEEAVQGHLDIAREIMNGDPDTAELKMRSHLQQSAFLVVDKRADHTGEP